MTVGLIGALPIGGINVAAAASIGLVAPLFAQLDLALFGAFGLGPLEADIALQFKAAVDVSLGLSLGISDPFAGIAALANLLASIQITLPTVTLELSAAIAANISLAAALSLKLGGISALIEAMIAVKLPAVNFFAQLAAALSAGPVFLLNFDNPLLSGGLAGAGAQIAAQFSVGLVDGANFIAPGDGVFGIILLTKDPTVFASLGTVLKIA
jgi:hypothetical protein